MFFKLNDRLFGILHQGTDWLIAYEVKTRKLYAFQNAEIEPVRSRRTLLSLSEMPDAAKSYYGTVAPGLALVGDELLGCMIGHEDAHGHQGWTVQLIEGAGQ